MKRTSLRRTLLKKPNNESKKKCNPEKLAVKSQKGLNPVKWNPTSKCRNPKSKSPKDPSQSKKSKKRKQHVWRKSKKAEKQREEIFQNLYLKREMIHNVLSINILKANLSIPKTANISVVILNCKDLLIKPRLKKVFSNYYMK